MTSLLAILFAFELGVVPGNGWFLYEDQELFEPAGVGYYTQLDAEVQYGPAFVGGSVRTDMTPDSLGSWNPHWMTYRFNAGVRWNLFEVGYRHQCTHPLQTYVYNQSYLKTPILEGAYDEVYARMSVEVGR